MEAFPMALYAASDGWRPSESRNRPMEAFPMADTFTD
jgi:hypothetical protein